MVADQTVKRRQAIETMAAAYGRGNRFAMDRIAAIC
jgi:hypothetical protein